MAEKYAKIEAPAWPSAREKFGMRWSVKALIQEANVHS